MELREIENSEMLLTLNSCECLMCQVLFPHNEELEVCTEEQKLKTFWVLITEIFYQTIEYIDDHHVPNRPII